MRTAHERVQPSECDLREAIFGQKGDLNKHKRHIHSIKAQTRIKRRAEQTSKALSDHGFTFDKELRIKFSRRAERPFFSPGGFRNVAIMGVCVLGGR